MAAAMACAIPTGQAHARGMTLENAKGTVHIYENDYALNWYGISSTDWNIKKEPTGIKLSNKKFARRRFCMANSTCILPSRVKPLFPTNGKARATRWFS